MKLRRRSRARSPILGYAAGLSCVLAALASSMGCSGEVDSTSEAEDVSLAAVECGGATPWDPNQHWSTYKVGDRRTDASKLFECHTPSWCQSYPPSSEAGHYGWAAVGTCGTTTCVPTTCAAVGATCGSISDKCGATLQCGSCSSTQTCSATNQCQVTGGGGSGGTGGGGGNGGGGGGTLGKHSLIGYWHNFTNPSGCTYPLSQVSNDWDVIVVSFAENDRASNGTVLFHPFGTLDSPGSCPVIDANQFKADIAAKKAAGKIVVLSLGGAEGTITLNSASDEANFVSSLTGLIREWGFNGIDVDLESGSGLLHGSQIQTRLVSGIKSINRNVGGNMYLSMAPEHPYVQGGVVAFSSIWGAYLPIIDGLRDELDMLHVQLYNNSSVPTPNTPEYRNGKTYPEATVDNLVVSATMLIDGFTTASGWRFNGLPASKVAFGLPSGRSSSNSPVTSNATITSAFRCLTQRSGCGEHVPSAAHPDFGGVMTWSINWDSHDGFGFSREIGALMNGQ